MYSYYTYRSIEYYNMLIVYKNSQKFLPPIPETPGKRLSSGTTQLSMYTDPVLDALNDIFPGMTAVDRPAVPLSTMNPRTRPSSHLAHTTKMSATGALVIHILDPFKTYDLVSESYLALLSIFPMSLPAFGSVRQKLPTRSAVASRGRYRSRCSSVPYALMACMTSDDWTLKADLKRNLPPTPVNDHSRARWF